MLAKVKEREEKDRKRVSQHPVLCSKPAVPSSCKCQCFCGECPAALAGLTVPLQVRGSAKASLAFHALFSLTSATRGQTIRERRLISEFGLAHTSSNSFQQIAERR